MKANVLRVKNNILFEYRFFCPIDKRWSYFNENDKICFGACRKFMGEITSVIPVSFNKTSMTVA